MPSDEEMFRRTVRIRDLNGESYTVIMTRRGLGLDARVWLILNGAVKTAVSMVGSEVGQLCELLTKEQPAELA